jgi:hypothetical protein
VGVTVAGAPGPVAWPPEPAPCPPGPAPWPTGPAPWSPARAAWPPESALPAVPLAAPGRGPAPSPPPGAWRLSGVGREASGGLRPLLRAMEKPLAGDRSRHLRGGYAAGRPRPTPGPSIIPHDHQAAPP